jgi:hypothetical protein
MHEPLQQSLDFKQPPPRFRQLPALPASAAWKGLASGGNTPASLPLPLEPLPPPLPEPPCASLPPPSSIPPPSAPSPTVPSDNDPSAPLEPLEPLEAPEPPELLEPLEPFELPEEPPEDFASAVASEAAPPSPTACSEAWLPQPASAATAPASAVVFMNTDRRFVIFITAPLIPEASAEGSRVT